MAKAKNTFLKSKMNKDLDARIIPSGEYRDAQNAQVSRSDGENVGSLENILGNQKIQDFGTLTGVSGLKCIGYLVDDSSSVVYLFLTDYTDPKYPSAIVYSTSANNFIYSVNTSNGIATKLVEGAFLNFSRTNPIYGVNIIEDLLFWTDNRNQPRKINVKLATPGFYTNEDQISVAKYNPHQCIELYAESSLSDGDYECTMKDVVSEYFPNGGMGTVNATISSGGTTVDLRAFEGDIVEPNTTYDTLGATVSYTDIQGNVIDISGVTVSSASYNSSTSVWTITVTGGTLPALSASVQKVILNANPYYDKDFPGDPDYLEDKFVRFAYRFKFIDNEYSLFSTFTQAAFIPKQDGYFMYVNKDDLSKIDDEADAYRSTIVSFVENKVNDIKLRVPLPFKNFEIKDQLKLEEIDILYKESDGASVKVVDTIDIETIRASSAECLVNGATSSSTTVDVDNVKGGIQVGSVVTGFGITTTITVDSYTPDDPNQNPSTSGTITLSSAISLADDVKLTIGDPYYYVYDYQSQKPFKTLPEKDLIRVSDIIPVRSFAQEISGNRVIYANYQNRHTPPKFINYNVGITEKPELQLNNGTADVSGGPYAPGTTTISYSNLDFIKSGGIQPGMIVICDGVPEGTLVATTTGGNPTGSITLDTATTATINTGQLIIFEPGGDVQNTTSRIEYPNSSLKTNRNYQVGVVLSDRYGRQSSVILTDNKEKLIFGNQEYSGSTIYSPYNDESIEPDEWAGNSIKMLFNEVIGTTKNLQTGEPGVYNGDSTSSDYNPLGWYSFKVVVKQTEQEYYNVYLPGIMAAYPDDQTKELGRTSHVVLINDNINKIPRDLSEVGPTQRQFRSSVELYGRVENSDEEITTALANRGQSNVQYYPERTSDITNSVATVVDLFDYNAQDTPEPNFFPQFYSLESNPFVARISTQLEIGQVSNVNFNAVTGTAAVSQNSDTISLVNLAGVTGDIAVGDNVTGPGFPSDLKVDTGGFTAGTAGPQGVAIDTASTSTTIDLFTNAGVIAGQLVTGAVGIPEGTIVLTVSSTTNEITVNNICSVLLTDTLDFQNPGTLNVTSSVNVVVGDTINVYSAAKPGIQQLAVYETRPVESQLDIFWETSTSGLVSDINNIILNENPSGAGAANLSSINDDPFTEALTYEGQATGEYDKILNSPIYLVTNFGNTVPSGDIDTPLALDSVIDGNGNDVSSYFTFEETGSGTYQYDIRITDDFIGSINILDPQDANVWYGDDPLARSFTFNFSAEVNDLWSYFSETLALGNVAPGFFNSDSSQWNDCPIEMTKPGNTTTYNIGNIVAANGAGGMPPTGRINNQRRRNLTFEKISETNTSGQETDYFALDFANQSGDLAYNATIPLVNNGFNNPSMPADKYTVRVRVSDPGDSVECDFIVDCGIKTCQVQEWTISGYIANPGTNISSGVAYEASFIFIRVCEDSGLFNPNNGWYIFTGGRENGNETDGDSGPWNNLISVNGSNVLQIPLNPPSQFVTCTQWKYTTGIPSTNPTPTEIDNAVGQMGDCIPNLVYGGNPDAYSWSLTGGTASSFPLTPSINGYTFEFQY